MKKIYSLIAAVLLCCTTTAFAGELKIGDNGSSTYGAPVYVTQADKCYCSQMLYSATELTALDGQQITKLAFFLRALTGNGNYDYVQIRLMEVDFDEFASVAYVSINDATLVFEGTLPANTNTTLEVELSEPFVYNGGNILIDVRKTQTGGGYAPSSSSGGKGRFQATSTTKTTVLYNYNSSSLPTSCSSMAVRPDIRFTYEEAPVASCAKISSLEKSEITSSSAKLTWTSDATSFQFVNVLKGETPDWAFVEPQAVKTITIESLKSNTEYDFYVRSYCGAGEGEQGAAKKVAFTTEKSCFEPASLSISNITENSATITWEASGHGETQYQYTYAVSGNDANWDNAVLTSNLTATLSDLNASTLYQVWVRSYCGEDDQSAAISDNFATSCGSVLAPWSNNFETETADAVPNCWDNSESASSTISSDPKYIWGVYSYSSNQMLRMYNYYVKSGSALINTPNIVLPASPAQELTFKYSHTATCGNFTVKISKDNGANWTDLQSYAKTSAGNSPTDPGEFTDATINLKDYAGETVILQFFATANFGNGAIFVDDFDIHNAPSCIKPTDLAVSDITSESATISWTGDADDYEVEFSVNADLSDSTSVKVVGAKQAGIEGLNASTDYYVRVRAVCGETEKSDYTAIANFRTECGAKTLPYVQDFESTTAGSGNVPECWEQLVAGTYPYVYDYESYAHGGTKSLTFYGVDINQVAVLPPFAEPTNKLTISFYYRASAGTSYPAVKVGYIDGSNFVALQTLEQAASYTLAEVNLAGAPANARVAIQYVGGSGWYYGSLYVDDITVDLTPSCVKPIDVVAAPISDSKASIAWTAQGEETAWQIEYSLNADLSDSVSVDVTTNPDTISGLAASTTYYVRLRAKCGEEDFSAYSAIASFTTPCAAVTVENASWDFEDQTAETVPSCWDNSASTSASTSHYLWGVFSYSDNKMLRLNNYYAQNGTALINTPSIVIPSAANKELRFDYEHSASCGDFTIKVSKDGGLHFTNLQSFTKNSTANYYTPAGFTTAKISLADYAGETIVLQFFANANYGSGAIFLDNVRIVDAPTCTQPATIEVTDILPDGATIAWTAGNGENRFQYRVGEDDWALLDEDVLSITLHGYAPGTDQTIEVRAYCSSESQSEAISTSFTPACAAPTAAEVTAVNTTTASISWTAAAHITHYQYKLNDEPWAEEKKVEGTSLELSELTPGTSYTFYVRSYFSETIQSDATSIEFVTECAAVAKGALPWSENFDALTAGVAPICWEVVDANKSGYPSITVSAGSSLTISLENNALFFSGTNASYGYIKFPEFEAQFDSLQIAFAHQAESSSYSGNIDLGYFAESSDEFTLLNEFAPNYGEYKDEEVSLKGVPANARLAFRYKSNSSYEYAVAVDNIIISVRPVATAIDNTGTDNNKKATKRIENGMLIIENNGVLYNAQGARVSK